MGDPGEPECWEELAVDASNDAAVGTAGLMAQALVDLIRRDVLEPELRRMRRRVEELEAKVEAQAKVLDQLRPDWRVVPQRRR